MGTGKRLQRAVLLVSYNMVCASVQKTVAYLLSYLCFFYLQGIFIKDSNSLAYYNVTPASVVQLQLKERGGRKKWLNSNWLHFVPFWLRVDYTTESVKFKLFFLYLMKAGELLMKANKTRLPFYSPSASPLFISYAKTLNCFEELWLRSKKAT